MKFKGTIVGPMSGSLAGLTASHNRGGQYFRQRSTPTDPNTSRQQAVKGVFNGLVQAWNSVLTALQRQAWKDWADATPTTDALGDVLVLTGQQAYIAANTPRVQAAQSGLTTTLVRVDTAPVVYDTGEPVSAVGTVEEAAGAFDAVCTLAAPASAAAVALLYWGRPVNEGRTFYKGPFQLAAQTAVTAAATAATFEDVDTADPAEWQAEAIPVIGERRPVRLIVCYEDGRTSGRYIDFVTPVAGA